MITQGEIMLVWLYIGIIMIMRVVQSLFSKKNATILGKNAVIYVKYTVYYQGVAGVFALILFLIELASGQTINGVGETFIYASISGIALAISTMCSVYILCQGTMVLGSLFGTAGLIIPTIACIFLYQEYIEWYQWVAIGVFMIGAFFLAGGSRKIYGKFTFSQLLVLISSLVLSGVTMLMQKMFGMEVEGGSVSLFSLISFVVSVVLFGIVLIIFKLIRKPAQTKQYSADQFTFFPKNEQDGKLPKQSLIYGVVLAFAVFLINQLSTISTPLIEAVILFAIICGGATVVSAIVGAVVYKERITINTILGLILGIGSLILLKI